MAATSAPNAAFRLIRVSEPDEHAAGDYLALGAGGRRFDAGRTPHTPFDDPAAATRRDTTAWVSTQPLTGSLGSRSRTWFDANVMSPGRRPGSGAPKDGERSCIAVARDNDAPNRTTSQPSSRASDATPADSAESRSSAPSTSRTTGAGIGPYRSVTSWRNAARSPSERARASRR